MMSGGQGGLPLLLLGMLALFVFIFFFAIAPPESAVSFAQDGSMRIDARQNITPEDSPFRLNVSAGSANFAKGGEALLLEREGGQWRVAKRLRLEGSNLSAGIELLYAGKGVVERDFALVAKGADGAYAGKEFRVGVDWRIYEKRLEGWLWPVMAGAGVIFLLCALGGAAALARFSGRQRHETEFEGEYSLRSLFVPLSSSLGPLENFANIFVNVYFWAAELALLALFLFIVFAVGFARVGGVSSLLIFITGGAVAFSFPFIYAVAVWVVDYKEREPLRFVVSLFLWGTLAAFLSLVANSALGGLLALLLSGGVAKIFSALLVAPPLEELIKGLGVLFLSFHHEFDDAMDGLLYGFVIGVGFSFAENWLYFASNVPPPAVGFEGWLAFLAMRTFLSSLGHGMFTAATGAAIGYAKQRGMAHPQLAFIPGVAAAAMLHMLFNSSAVLDAVISLATKVELPFITAPLVALGLSLFAVAVYFALKSEGAVGERFK